MVVQREGLPMRTPRTKVTLLAIALAGVMSTSSCSSVPANTPSLREALDTHIEKVGGREALQSLIVIEREGRFVLEKDGQSYAGSYHTCVHYPHRVAIAIDAGPVQVHQVLGHNGALECGPGFSECQTANEHIAMDLVDTAKVANREQLYMVLPAAGEYDVVDSKDSVEFNYELHSILRGIEFYKGTGLIRSLRFNTKIRRLEDWRAVGSVMLPFSIIDRDGENEKVSVSLSTVEATGRPTSWCEQAFARTTE